MSHRVLRINGPVAFMICQLESLFYLPCMVESVSFLLDKAEEVLNMGEIKKLLSL